MSITIQETDATEQVLIGDHNGITLIVLGVKPGDEFAETCWQAAQQIANMEAFADSSAIIYDIPNAHIRHAYVTEMT